MTSTVNWPADNPVIMQYYVSRVSHDLSVQTDDVVRMPLPPSLAVHVTFKEVVLNHAPVNGEVMLIVGATVSMRKDTDVEFSFPALSNALTYAMCGPSSIPVNSFDVIVVMFH